MDSIKNKNLHQLCSLIRALFEQDGHEVIIFDNTQIDNIREKVHFSVRKPNDFLCVGNIETHFDDHFIIDIENINTAGVHPSYVKICSGQLKTVKQGVGASFDVFREVRFALTGKKKVSFDAYTCLLDERYSKRYFWSLNGFLIGNIILYYLFTAQYTSLIINSGIIIFALGIIGMNWYNTKTYRLELPFLFSNPTTYYMGPNGNFVTKMVSGLIMTVTICVVMFIILLK